jgi:uncharacterized protein YkwD
MAATARAPVVGVVRAVNVAPTGTAFIAFEEEQITKEPRTGTRMETRAVTENGQTRDVQQAVPYQYIVDVKKKVTKEVPWSPVNGEAFEMNGQPVTPPSEALRRLQPGDQVLWMQGKPGRDVFERPYPAGVKMVLASPPAMPRMMSGPAPMPVPPIAIQPAPPTVGDVSPLEKDVIAKVNEARATAGLPPFQINATLMKAARQHSANMARQGKLEHVLDGKGPHERIAELGLQAGFTGENCAQGQNTAAEAMESWMSSPGHRGNILNPTFTHIGVGKVDGPDGPYWTQVFARIDEA